ncbi:MAG: DUF4360 domain-containing protein [Aquificaceae bacterium]|nr:MAG: DUF4360 domain-containing protein [Aquificaceae bacterium]
MKILSTMIATTVLGFALTTSASAGDPVYFKAPINFAGTGCPAGTIAVTGENTDTLTLLFDSYDAARPSSEAASGRRRSSCNFAVPVHVPQGFQASILTVDWRGFVEGKGQLKRQYFFAGNPNAASITNNFNKPNGGDFYKRDGLTHGSVAFSRCGKDKILRINSSVRAKTNGSYIAVDTVDLHNRVVFQLQWRRCSS